MNHITISFDHSTVRDPEDCCNYYGKPVTISKLIKNLQKLIDYEGVAEDTPVFWYEPQYYGSQYANIRVEYQQDDEEEEV